jgi:hypothetical protein
MGDVVASLAMICPQPNGGYESRKIESVFEI